MPHRPHTGVAALVAYAALGFMLGSSGLPGGGRLARAADGYARPRLYATIALGACCATAVAWSPDARGLAVGVGATVRLLRRDGASIATLPVRGTAVTSVTWSPDGRTIAAGDRAGVVHVYRSDGAALTTLTGHRSAVTTVAWSSDGQVLASGSADGTVRLWQSNFQLLTVVPGDATPVRGLTWSPVAQAPYGRMLAIAGGDHVRLQWLGGRTRAVLGRLGGPTSVAWSPNGRAIVVGAGDKSVRLVSVAGSLLASLRGHTAAVTSVTWAPDSTMFASGSRDKTVRVWAADGRPRATLRGPTRAIDGVAWSPDGKTLAVAADGTVRLWSMS